MNSDVCLAAVGYIFIYIHISFYREHFNPIASALELTGVYSLIPCVHAHTYAQAHTVGQGRSKSVYLPVCLCCGKKQKFHNPTQTSCR